MSASAAEVPVQVGALLAQAGLRIAQNLHLEPPIARLEARVLAAHAWQVPTSWLIAHDTDALTSPQRNLFETLLEKRLRGEPIAYITGEREFFGRAFCVTPAVLIPRPETELLVESVLAQMPSDQAIDILELGTGSGCIAISLALARPLARVTAVDKSAAALVVAEANARRWRAPVKWLKSDWFDALGTQQFDWIVSNPPYVPIADPHLQQGDVRFEPMHALQSETNGLADLERIIQQAPRYLKPQGGLLVEHGYNQAEDIAKLLKQNRFDQLFQWRDLAQHLRVSGGFLSE